uniref:Si:dkeyp-19e1.4 n=1 Tax=Nothobranchius kuhntae TaxID=321403 RepID=A0A1A8KL82_NOTKU
MKTRLLDGKFMSVMSDGSLDSAVMEEEIVYVRSASEGKVQVDFVGVKSVSKPDAANIAEAVCGMLDSEVSTDWKKKLVAITTDGASVMTGVNNGVVTKLRGDRCYVLGIHCMAHKLELSFSDGIRKNVMVRKVEDLLSGLYTLYHKSGVNRASLKDHFRELHLKPLMPTRIGGTWWLPHFFNAFDHFLRGYVGFVHHLEEKSQNTTNTNAVLRAKAKGFLNIAKDGGVLRFCCLLHDTIYQLSSLSKSLQRSVSTLAEAQSCLSSTQAAIQKYKSRPGPKLRSVLDTDTYEGVLLKPSDAGQHNKAKNELIGSLCQCITARFSDVNSGVLHAMRLTSFQCWPEADTSFDFGDEEINKLTSHFRPLLLSAGVDVDLIPDQWTILKAELYTAGFSQGTFEKTWPTVNRMLRHRCPDVLYLFDALLTIPASTADCERGFSVMKQVKSDWHSCPKSPNDLRPVALTSLVMKAMEKIIKEHIVRATEPLMDPLQFAYRARRGADDVKIFILDTIHKHLELPDSSARLLFVDFSSAFNTLQPHILATKLSSQFHLDDQLTLWILDFLTNRTQKVWVNNCLSGLRSTSTGSPQGCVLSPLLYILSTDDCRSTHPNCHLVKYADDSPPITVVRLLTTPQTCSSGVCRMV